MAHTGWIPASTPAQHYQCRHATRVCGAAESTCLTRYDAASRRLAALLLPDSMPCRLVRHGFFVELLRAVRRVYTWRFGRLTARGHLRPCPPQLIFLHQMASPGARVSSIRKRCYFLSQVFVTSTSGTSAWTFCFCMTSVLRKRKHFEA